MGRIKRHLQVRRDANRPVKAIGVIGLATALFHQRHRFFHLPRHFRRIVDDDPIVTTGGLAQSMGDKLVQHAEVVGALFRSGEDQRQHLRFVLRMHQNTQQIEQLFGSADAAREDNDPVGDAHEGFQTLFDIRHDDQFVDQRVRRFCGNDGRFGHADKAAVFVALLRVADGGAFHRGLHRARPAAGADVQFAQSQLRTDAAGVEIFVFINGVTAPADDHVRCFADVQRAGVAQDRKHQVGDMDRTFQIEVREANGIVDLAVNEQDIAQHGEQVGLQGTDNTPVNESFFRRVDQFQLHATFATQHVNIEVFKTGEQLLAVIGQAPRVKHSKRAVAKELIQVTAGGALKHIHFQLRQHIH